MVQTVARPLKEAQELVLPATLLTTVGIAPYTRDKLDQIRSPHLTPIGRKTVLVIKDKELEILNQQNQGDGYPSAQKHGQTKLKGPDIDRESNAEFNDRVIQVGTNLDQRDNGLYTNGTIS